MKRILFKSPFRVATIPYIAMYLEEDTYSVIFSALKHPARRKIIRMLSEGPLTYTELQNKLEVETGFLNYYLESLNGLIKKDENSRYRISGLGRSALGLMMQVEEPTHKTEPRKIDIFGFKVNAVYLMLALVFMLIASNGYWLLGFQRQSQEKTDAFSENLVHTKALLSKSIDILNATIQENRISFYEWDLLSRYLLQASSRLDFISFLDAGHQSQWLQAASATKSLAQFFNDACDSLRVRYQNQTYLDIKIGQGWMTTLPMIGNDFNEMYRSIPNLPETDLGTGTADPMRLLKVSLQLQEDLYMARRAVGIGEKIKPIY